MAKATDGFEIEFVERRRKVSDMSTLLIRLMGLALVMFSASVVSGQVKAPSQYFRKDSPNRPGQQNPPASPNAPSSAAAAPKFKDVAVNSQFYFMTDTNRAYPWTKISDSKAKNSKSGATAPVSANTPVRR